MAVAAVYILYLLFLIVRACTELRNMPYVGEHYFRDHLAALMSPDKAVPEGALHSWERQEAPVGNWPCRERPVGWKAAALDALGL